MNLSSSGRKESGLWLGSGWSLEVFNVRWPVISNLYLPESVT
jgi:hypothetical protein